MDKSEMMKAEVMTEVMIVRQIESIAMRDYLRDGERLIDAFCYYHHIHQMVLHSHSRSSSVTKYRHQLQFLMRHLYPDIPLRVIGMITGMGRDYNHSTIHAAIRKIDRQRTLITATGKHVYPELARDINAMIQIMRPTAAALPKYYLELMR
jgi:chromosomal replication initiation ATPase DnaA